MARKPLMAGNWKMNLNHVEAVGLVQKLAWTLDDKQHDPDKSEVVVLPPFTDLRTVQTLIEGDRLTLGYGAQDVSAARRAAPTPARSRPRCWPSSTARYVTVGHSERAKNHHEDDELVNAKAQAGAQRRRHADHLRRRGSGGPRGRAARGALPGPGQRRADRV